VPLRAERHLEPVESGWRAARALIAGLLLVGVLIAAPLTYAAIRASRAAPKPPLPPVHVSGSACPVVVSIRSAADDEVDALRAVENSTRHSWAKTQADLLTALDRLDQRLGRGVAVLPDAVGVKLRTVESNIRVAKPAVAHATSYLDLWRRVYMQVNAGDRAYGDAMNRLDVSCGGL
jgi:hypothetical protein